MPSYSDKIQEEHKELVKNALALKPRAGVHVIADMLKKAGRSLDAKYVNKIKRKIIQERQLRFNEKKVNERISEIEEKANIVQEKLWEILLGKYTNDSNKVAAARAIVETEKKLFESQMDAGIFERKIGEVAIRHSIDPNDPAMIAVMNAFRNYGIIKKTATVIEPKQLDGPTAN